MINSYYITTVIQFHVLGMFLPSFFTGSLIARFGSIKIMLAGIICFVGYILVGLSNSVCAFALALALLGMGWKTMNLLLIFWLVAITLLLAWFSLKKKTLNNNE